VTSRWTAIFVLLFAGCGGASRRPLLSFDSRPSGTPRSNQPAAVPLVGPGTDAPPTRPTTALRPDPALITSMALSEDVASLVARLEASQGSERKLVLDKLVALGERAHDELARASEAATFQGDVLREALLRLDEQRSGPPDSKRAVIAPWVEAKYRLALDRFLAGDDLGAQNLVDAILMIEPECPQRPRLERLRRQIRDHFIAETVIAASIVPEEKFLVPGTPLRAKIRLWNRTREDLLIKSAPGAPLGQIVLDYEELEPDGTRSMRRTTRNVRAPENGIRLAAHERVEVPVELPTEHATKERNVVGRYRLAGKLRPFTLLAGEEPIPWFLPLPLIEVVVLDPDLREAGDHPRDAFLTAVKAAKGARAETDPSCREAFAAALVWSSAEREAACAGIVSALETSEGALSRMLCAALARATGEPGNYSREEWLEWWKTARSRPRAARTPGEPEDDEAMKGPR
jgi:hypothetical protein